MEGDGETVFRGGLLDDGPVARLLPEIWENPVIMGYRDHADLTGQTTEAVQLLIAALRAQAPTFFDRFGTEMQSGDHIRILRAIDEGGDRLKKVAGDFKCETDLDKILSESIRYLKQRLADKTPYNTDSEALTDRIIREQSALGR
jgi:SdpC family antimicrobial peptide